MLQYQPKLYQICPSAYGDDWWGGGGDNRKVPYFCLLMWLKRFSCILSLTVSRLKLKQISVNSPPLQGATNYTWKGRTVLTEPSVQLVGWTEEPLGRTSAKSGNKGTIHRVNQCSPRARGEGRSGARWGFCKGEHCSQWWSTMADMSGQTTGTNTNTMGFGWYERKKSSNRTTHRIGRYTFGDSIFATINQKN